MLREIRFEGASTCYGEQQDYSEAMKQGNSMYGDRGGHKNAGHITGNRARERNGDAHPHTLPLLVMGNPALHVLHPSVFRK